MPAPFRLDAPPRPSPSPRRRKAQRGQGTIEYVGVVVMVTLLMAALGSAAAGWSGDIGNKLKDTVKAGLEKVGDVDGRR